MLDAAIKEQVPINSRCDLIMQGGITSGIVYPPAIMVLKDSYRFHDIGGTSAGAIAAAGAAASEYGREMNNFQELSQAAKWLGAKRNMRDLFQPSAETRSLMDLVDILFAPSKSNSDAEGTRQKKGWFGSIQSRIESIWDWLRRCIPLRWLWFWLTRYPRPSLGAFFGMLCGLFCAFILSLVVFGVFSLFWRTLVTSSTSVFWNTLIVSGLLGLWLGYQVGALIDALWKLSNEKNFYGICAGHEEPDSRGAHVLTDWMTEELDTMAGLEKKNRPLTFGHLSRKRLRKNSNGQFERCEDGEEGIDASINLQMITTNLSLSRPYVLPTDLRGFLFKETDMRQLFPELVVEHMKKYSGTYSLTQRDVHGKALKTVNFTAPGGYYFLPSADNLPVVFAMRLSLSFPILLSAVPLYTIKAEVLKSAETEVRLEEENVQVHWFSDGGICNNFPIEFFDAWIPGHPTFGINLTSMPQETFTNGNKQNGIDVSHVSALGRRRSLVAPQNGGVQEAPGTIPSVYLPKAQDVQDPIWQGFLHTWEFLMAVIGTGLGYRDSLQANLPSYRERIVQIRLNRDEGGLNLNMSPATIRDVIGKGEDAGKLLKGFCFEHHQWVRFLVLMNQLEYNLGNMQEVIAVQPLEQLLKQQVDAYEKQPYPYARNQEWCDEAKKFVECLITLMNSWRTLAEDWEASQKLQSASNADINIPRFFNYDVPEPEPELRVAPEV